MNILRKKTMSVNKTIITNLIDEFNHLNKNCLDLSSSLGKYLLELENAVGSKDIEGIDTNELLNLLAMVHEDQNQINKLRGQFIAYMDVDCMYRLKAIDPPKKEDSTIVSIVDFNKTEE